KKIFSLPVSSALKPVPISKRLFTLPFPITVPEVGLVIRERILSNVDLPDPLLPIIPNTSPCFTSKFTFFRAHNNWCGDLFSSLEERGQELSVFSTSRAHQRCRSLFIDPVPFEPRR